MANKELIDFVKQGLEAGQSRQSISDALLTAGWKLDEVKNAIHSFADVDFPIAVPRPRPYLSARVAFLYLLFFIMLAIVAWSLGSLLFSMINMAFPDAANSQPIYGAEGYQTNAKRDCRLGRCKPDLFLPCALSVESKA